MSQESNTVVLVTGGTGFVASWTVKLLLEQGYKVRATVRDVKSHKADFLRAIPGADARLELVAANLLSSQGWDEAVKGCTYVHHIASPYVLQVKDAQKDLVDPALNGTLNVLNACLKEPSVRKVILTSTLLAVSDSFDKPQYGPDDWNTASSLTRNPYPFSKVLAEKAAHAFMKEKKPAFELAVINPFAVIGPSMDKSGPLNESVEIINNYLLGKIPYTLPGAIGFVDVRDVALAHVLAMKNPRATGGKRYLLTAGNATGSEIVEAIQSVTSNKDVLSKLPTRDLPWWFPKWLLLTIISLTDGRDKATFIGTTWGALPNIDVSLSKKDLGLEYTDVKKSLRDTVQWLLNERSPSS